MKKILLLGLFVFGNGYGCLSNSQGIGGEFTFYYEDPYGVEEIDLRGIDPFKLVYTPPYKKSTGQVHDGAIRPSMQVNTYYFVHPDEFYGFNGVSKFGGAGLNRPGPVPPQDLINRNKFNLSQLINFSSALALKDLEEFKRFNASFDKQMTEKILLNAQNGNKNTAEQLEELAKLYKEYSEKTEIRVKEFDPNPLYPNMNKKTIDKQLDPLYSSLKKGDLNETVREIQKIQINNLHRGSQSFEAEYIKRELKTKYLDERGLIKHIPQEFTVPRGYEFVSDGDSVQGINIRAGISQVGISALQLNQACGQESADCQALVEFGQTINSGYVIADRISKSADPKVWNNLYRTLKEGTQFFTGLVDGVMSGAIQVGVGAVAAGTVTALTGPAGLAVVGVAAISYAVYDAIKDVELSEIDSEINNWVEQKYSDFVSADSEQKGEMIGKLAVDVADILYGGRIGGVSKKLIQSGVVLTATERSLQKLVGKALSSGEIDKRVGGNLSKLISSAPELAESFIDKKNLSLKLDAVDKIKNLSDSSVKAFSKISKSGAIQRVSSHLEKNPHLDLESLGQKYVKLFDELDKLPGQLSSKVRILHGDPDKIAIVGRGMGDNVPVLDKIQTTDNVGVLNYKSHLELKDFKVTTFKPSRSAKKKWDESIKEKAKELGFSPQDTRLTLDQVIKSEMYLENKAWIQNLKKENYTIIDIGDPVDRYAMPANVNQKAKYEDPFSVFYTMEKNEIFWKKTDGAQ